MAQLVALKLEEEQLLPSQTKVTVIGSLVYYQLACGVGAVKVHFMIFLGYGSPPVFSSRSLPVLTNVFLVQNGEDGLSGASLRYIDNLPIVSMSTVPSEM